MTEQSKYLFVDFGGKKPTPPFSQKRFDRWKDLLKKWAARLWK